MGRALPYVRDPDEWIQVDGGRIAHFSAPADANVDAPTVASFGREWEKFGTFTEEEIARIGDEYFDVVDFARLGPESVVLDVGCGSGRWTRYVAPKVGFVEAVDPSGSVAAAHALTRDLGNVRVTRAGVDNLPFTDGTFDFVFSLGVMHHLPDTAAGLASAVRKLKPGGLFLTYLYYNLDNRGVLYRWIFRASNVVRGVVSRLPVRVKEWVCEAIAVSVYFPLAMLARAVRAMLGRRVAERIPLHYYADKSWWVMRNDALDRFGTPLEQRFSRAEILEMMEGAGLEDVLFSETAPFWHAIGTRSDPERASG